MRKEDYVNGIRVIKVLDGFAEGTMEIILANGYKITRFCAEEEINTLVSSEQFSSVEYVF